MPTFIEVIYSVISSVKNSHTVVSLTQVKKWQDGMHWCVRHADGEGNAQADDQAHADG